MVNPPALTAAIAGAHRRAVPMSDLLFRAIHLRHFSNFAAAQALFCAVGGPAGSRFVAPNGPAALYLALDPETAYEEFNQLFFNAARTPAGRALVQAGNLRPDPCVILGIHFRVSRLLSLAFPFPHWRRTRTALGINTASDAEMTQPWAGIVNAPTQVLGTEVFNDGFFEGIIYPSARRAGGNCIVVFRQRLLATSRIQFSNGPTAMAGQLP